MTCCRFSSFKTLLTRRSVCPIVLNVLLDSLLAGFQVSLIGRFWVSPEAQEARGLGRLFQQLDSAYARCIHLRFGKVGHLWQARYASVAMEEKHMWAAMVYVEQNPVKAGLVEQASEWRWSSAAAHLSGDEIR